MIEESFGKEPFTAQQAMSVFPFTRGTSFVALSSLTKERKLRRIKKALYIVDEQSIKKAQNMSQASGNDSSSLLEMIKPVGKPELSLPPNSYVTGTYVLANTLSPYTSVNYLDVFVRPENYQEKFLDGSFQPQPVFYPLAETDAPIRSSMDQYPITTVEHALLDLIRVLQAGYRPVSLEYEITPFILQMHEKLDHVAQLAKKEGLIKQFIAIVLYIGILGKQVEISSTEDLLALATKQKMNGLSRRYPEVLSFAGGKVEEISREVFEKTGVVIEANKDAIIPVLNNM